MEKQEKTLIVKSDNKENSLLIDTINKFKMVQQELKKLKDFEKVLKDTLKQYDFEKVVIMNGENDNLVFEATQYFQTRKELDNDKLIDSILTYIKGDLDLSEYIHDDLFKKDLEKIIEQSHNEKKVKCVRYSCK